MNDYWQQQRYDDAYFALHGRMPAGPRPDDTDPVDDLPGMWDQSDLSGGETDAAETRRSEL